LTNQTWIGHDGVTIAGQAWGKRSHPLVVLLHGGGQTRHAWKGVGEALAANGYRVVAYDARGHGDSAGRRTATTRSMRWSRTCGAFWPHSARAPPR
jgi:alpha-beta hydrolase superfamily lysophospholipase